MADRKFWDNVTVGLEPKTLHDGSSWGTYYYSSRSINAQEKADNSRKLPYVDIDTFRAIF